jgi:hypothetical protein
MTERTHADLMALIQGLCGVNFATIELPRINALINRRATKAYRASNHWPRFLHVGEERAVTLSVIPFAEGVLDRIEVFLRIHKTLPFYSNTAQEFTFHVTSAGATLIAGALNPSSAFVTYKKAFTPTYTTSSIDIPSEWFDYLAHGTYADFLRSEGQQEKSALADAEAADILTDELLNIDQAGTTQVVATRFRTHLNTDSRSVNGGGGSAAPGLTADAPDLDAIFEEGLS